MARRPEIPEDVFFDPREDDKQSARGGQRSRRSDEGPRSYRRVSDETEADDQQKTSRVGRPPAQEGPKVAVTLYLTEPVAHRLEEARFLLLTEHDVKTSKSAIADFAIRHGLDDLAAAADDLRRD
ncbi:MAG: hypothetical protein ACP5KN_05575 [Armatimonadota bacterium]